MTHQSTLTVRGNSGYHRLLTVRGSWIWILTETGPFLVPPVKLKPVHYYNQGFKRLIILFWYYSYINNSYFAHCEDYFMPKVVSWWHVRKISTDTYNMLKFPCLLYSIWLSLMCSFQLALTPKSYKFKPGSDTWMIICRLIPKLTFGYLLSHYSYQILTDFGEHWQLLIYV